MLNRTKSFKPASARLITLIKGPTSHRPLRLGALEGYLRVAQEYRLTFTIVLPVLAHAPMSSTQVSRLHIQNLKAELHSLLISLVMARTQTGMVMVPT